MSAVLGAAARRRLAADDGVYAIELLGLFAIFAMVVVAAFQLAAVGGAYNQAENAARAGSRAIVQGGSPQQAALDAVDPGMRGRTSVGGSSCGGPITGTTVTVCIDMPVRIPFVQLTEIRVSRQATLPPRLLGGA